MSASIPELRLLAGLLVALALTLASRAAPPVVTNVRALQSGTNQPVKIWYNLQDSDSPTVRVSLEVFYEASPNVVVPIPASSLSGFGFGESVTPGIDRYILWNAPADWPGQQSSRVRFRVTANDGPVLAAPTLLAPPNNALTPQRPTFSWNPVNGADSYHIIIKQGTQVEVDTILVGVSFRPNQNLASGPHDWFVTAVSNGHEGPASVVRRIRVIDVGGG